MSHDHSIHYIRTLIEVSPDAITIVNASGEVVYWSKQAEVIYGIQSKKIKGKNISEFFEKEDTKLFEILETKEPVFSVYHQPRPDKHVLISSSPIFDKNGKLIGAISIDQDITSIVRLNEKLTLTTTQLQKLRQQYNVQGKIGPLSDIKGNSSAIRKTKEMALKVAKTDATVLVQGESGVGKELFSQGIHEASLRKYQPFIPVNCGAIPEALFESEFFGYEKGSFTGASKEGKPGKVEMANGGTLFLDEIGMLPLDMQVKLLRVLQESEVYRIGGNKPINIDIRVISATNSDLKSMVEQGLFREDLYYRLNVVTLNIPPLRERTEDISILVRSFIKEFAAKYDKTKPSLSECAMATFMNYHWPGNIRELKNIVERMMIFTDKEIISAEDLIHIFLPDAKNERPKDEKRKKLSHQMAQLEKEKIELALKKTYGNKSAAARKLGISRVTLYKKIKDYNIQI